MINIKLLRDMFHSRTKDFWLFESSIGLHIFASSLISIFIPVLFYKNGFSLSDILLYFLVFHFFAVFFGFFAEKSIYRFGSKKNIIFATIVNIIFFILLSMIGKIEPIVFVISVAFFAAIYDAYYYISTNYIFIGSNEKAENVRNNTNILSIIMGTAGFLGPLTGSLVLLSSGQAALIFIVILFFIFSLIPILKLEHVKTKPDHDPVNFKNFFSSMEEKKNFISLGLYKIAQGVEGFIWPLFIYIFFKDSVEAVAFLAVLIPVSGFIFTAINFFLGKEYQRILLITGSSLLIISWLLRIFIENEFSYYLGLIIASTALLSIQLPVDSNIYGRAKKIGPLATSTYKNSVAMFGKMILFLILFISSLFFTNDTVFNISFWIAVTSALFLIFIFFKKK